MLYGTIKSIVNLTYLSHGIIAGSERNFYFYISDCNFHHPQVGDEVNFTIGTHPRTGTVLAKNIRLSLFPRYHQCARCGKSVSLEAPLEKRAEVRFKCNYCSVVNSVEITLEGRHYIIGHIYHHYLVKIQQTEPNRFYNEVFNPRWVHITCRYPGEPTEEIKDMLMRMKYMSRNEPHITKILHIISPTVESFQQAGLDYWQEGFSTNQLYKPD